MKNQLLYLQFSGIQGLVIQIPVYLKLVKSKKTQIIVLFSVVSSTSADEEDEEIESNQKSRKRDKGDTFRQRALASLRFRILTTFLKFVDQDAQVYVPIE